MPFGIEFNLNGSKSKTKTSEDVTLDPWSRAQWETTAARLTDLLGANPASAYGGRLAAGVDPYQTAAASAAQGLLGYQPGRVSAGSFRDADLSGYLNPELDSVVDRTLAGYERNRQVQRVADNQAATAAGSWGGARHGVADSLTNEAFGRLAGDAEAGLRSQAYDNAYGRWAADRDARLQADQLNADLGLRGAELGLQGAGLLGQIGAQLREAEQAGLDRQYADFTRLQEDPYKRAGVLGDLLAAVPIGWDRTGTNKGWNLGASVTGGYKQAGYS